MTILKLIQRSQTSCKTKREIKYEYEQKTRKITETRTNLGRFIFSS